MSKLSDAVLEEGRQLIRAKDLDGFMLWIGKNSIIIDQLLRGLAPELAGLFKSPSEF